MRIGLTIRTLDGRLQELSIVDGHFRAAGESVDVEFDGSQLWAVPGLADCHAHLGGGAHDDDGSDEAVLARAVTSAWAQLEGGVFLVADKGAGSDATLRILDEPPTRRPELSMAGRIITVPGGYYNGFAREVDEKDLLSAVRDATGGGAEWVKLIGDWPRKGVGAVTNFSEKAMHDAVALAHRAGCRVAIHAAAPNTSTVAVAAGVDSIEHGLFLTPDDVAALGARGGAWVPTIAAMEAIRDMLGADSSGGKLFDDGLRNVRDVLGGAAEQGVAVLAGSDIEVPHGGIAIEAMKMAEYGMSAADVVHASTSAAYAYLGSEHRIEEGGHGDVLFFDNDPRDDLSVLARPILGIRHGEVVIGSLGG
ncbi:MAG: amidohydrolase family protein [Actinomycetota bacterium]